MSDWRNFIKVTLLLPNPDGKRLERGGRKSWESRRGRGRKKVQASLFVMWASRYCGSSRVAKASLCLNLIIKSSFQLSRRMLKPLVCRASSHLSWQDNYYFWLLFGCFSAPSSSSNFHAGLLNYKLTHSCAKVEGGRRGTDCKSPRSPSSRTSQRETVGLREPA